MVIAGPLARPWRDVEELAPAVLHGYRLQHCAVTATADSLTVRLGGLHDMVLTLTPGELAYNTVEGRWRWWSVLSSQPAAVAKLPLARLLGAKVVSTGLQRSSKHLQTAVVLVLSTDSVSGHSSETSAGQSAEGHDFSEVVMYSNVYPPLESSSASPSGRRNNGHVSSERQDPPPLLPAATMQTPLGASPPPQLFRMRRVACIPALPLSVQEYIASEINRFLEAVRGKGSVVVENDLLISLDGTPLPHVRTDSITKKASFANDGGKMGVAATAAAVGEPPAGPGRGADTGDGAAAASLNSTGKHRQPWLDVFDGTRPLCRPWRSTPLQPLAGSHVTISPGGMAQLEILWDSGATKNPRTIFSLVTVFLFGLLYALLIIRPRFASIPSHDHGNLEVSGDEGCAGNVVTATGVASESLRHLIWKPTLTPGAPSPSDRFSDGSATTQLESHVQQEGAPLHALSDLKHTSWVPAAGAPLMHPTSSATRATDSCVRAGGAAMITSLFTDHTLFWCAAVVLAYILVFVLKQMFSVCITLRATGFSVSHIGWPWRLWPLTAIWRLLVRMAGFIPNEDFSEPVLGAKVSAPTMPLASGSPYTCVELHTATCVHRVSIGDGRTTGSLQQTQDAETIVAAINRYARLQRRGSCHLDGHALAFEAHLRQLRPDLSPPAAEPTSSSKQRHAIEASHPAIDDMHAVLATTGRVNGGEHGVAVHIHHCPELLGIEECTAQVLPSVFTNLHLQYPFITEPPSARCARPRSMHRQLASAPPGQVAPDWTVGSGQMSLVRDHARNRLLPILQSDGRGDPLTFGRRLRDLKDAQQRAITSAVQKSTDDRRSVSAKIPPRASAHIRLLSISPGHLHMCLPANTSVVRFIISAVLTVMLCAAAACCGVALVDIVQHSLARSLKTSPLIAPGGLEFLQLLVDLVAGFMAMRTQFVWRPVYRDTFHVRVSPAGYIIARVPGWLPGAWAAAASQWRVFRVSHGGVADVVGAKVTVKTGRFIGPHTTAVLRVRQSNAPERLASDDDAPLTSESRDHMYKEVELCPGMYNASMRLHLFNVLDKIFVAAHINACLAEIATTAHSSRSRQ